MGNPTRINWRRIVLLAVLAGAVWALFTQSSAVANLLRVARGGSWQWLAVAAALQLGYYACYVLTMRGAFGAVGVRRPFGELVSVVLASIFVSTVTPAGAAGGTALIVDDAVRRGTPAPRSAAAVVLFELADFTGFGVVLLAGFGYLLAVGRLQRFEIVAGAVFLGIVVAFAASLVVAVRRPAVIAGLFVRLERVAEWLSARLHRERPAPWAIVAANDFTQAAELAAGRPSAVVRTWMVAVVGHLFDLFSLIAVGAAFGVHGVGVLLAAYVVGIVVWLTSFIPQGVGLVEAAMTIVLISFGVPAVTATTVSLVFRGLTFWLPFVAGFVALRKVKTFEPAARGASSSVVPHAAALLTALAGVVNILSAVTPSIRTRVAFLERVLPLQVQYGHLAAIVAGVGLLMLGRGLWRRKRMAWMIACALLATGVAGHLVKGLDWEEASVSAALLVWLLVERRHFLARSDTPSARQGLRVLGAAFGITLAYGTAGFWLLDRHFQVNFGLFAAVRQSVVMFTQFYDPGLQPITGFGRWFADSIYLVGFATFGYALLMLLRPVLLRAPATDAERERARDIVMHYGRSTLARMLLLPDKAYFFSEGGSVVGFAKVGDVALALGDPIGPAEDAARTIAEFRDMSARNGWRCAFYQTLPDCLDAYRAAGFDAVSIGDEAIVPVADFDMASQRKSLRSRVRKLDSDGYRVEVVPAPQDARMLREVRAVSDAWLAERGGSELGFSLGWFDEDYIGGCDLMVLRSPTGHVEAFANIISEYHADEATIDLMRYSPSAPSGTMDLLFIRLFEWARDAGYASFNLGLSALAGVGERPDDPAIERLLQLVYEYGNRFYGFQGLHEYKAKFSPVWQPRYLVFEASTDLPAVFSAIVQANDGKGALLPRLWRR